MSEINLILKFNSVTYALKARELLNSINIKSKLTRNPSPKKGEGCGYVLTVFRPKADIKEYLISHNVVIKDAVWK